MFELVTSAEILSTLKVFKASKSPGPDGWTVEFFLAFFDQLGEDLLGIVEESRKTGKVLSALNATFITLITKESVVEFPGKFHPIALCNVIFKIIMKVT